MPWVHARGVGPCGGAQQAGMLWLCWQPWDQERAMSNGRGDKGQGDILVVEDDPTSREALSGLLGNHGYAVRTAADGPTALQIVEVEPPDLILLDALVDGRGSMDGYEVCRRLKARSPSRDIPVLFVSTLDEATDRVKGFAAGGVDFISLPFQPEEVLARVATHLALRRAQKRLEAQNAELRKLSQAVEQSANTVVITDAQGRIEYANPRFEETTAYAVEEALGQNPRILKSGAHDEAYYRQMWTTITSGQTWRGEFYNKRKDGTFYWEQATIAPVVDESGEITGFIAVKEDITERKQAEEALKRRVEELAVLNRIAQLVATVTEMPEALKAVVEITAHLLAASSAAIIVWQGDRLEVRARFDSGHEPAEEVDGFLPLLQAAAIREPLQQGQVLSIADAEALALPTEAIAAFRARNLKALLLVPLRVRGTTFGLVAVARERTGPAFSEAEVSLAETIATDVAAAIENARLYERAQELAVIQERSRLARDLHDSVTQTLYSVALLAETLPRVWERHPQEAWQALNDLHRLARGALGEMRTLLLELRPAILLEKDLADLLRQLAEAAMGRAQLQVETRVRGERSLPGEVRIVLYRVTQEALNNVLKHAAASRAVVELDLGPEQVVLRVQDDGRGFDPQGDSGQGFGVQNMADRAAGIGARFHLWSQPGQGTGIELVWQEREDGASVEE